MSIERIKYLNKRNNASFEIVKFEDFISRNKKSMLEKDYRLNFFSMLYITEGSSIHSIDFKEYKIEKNDLVILEKNKIHSFRVNKSIKGYVININEPFFINNNINYDYNLLAFFEAPFEKPILKINTDKTATNRILIDLIYKEYTTGVYREKETLIKSLFQSFISSFRYENDSIIQHFSISVYKTYYKYRELVEKNFTTIKDVQTYASIMGVTKKTINKACRDCADISAKQLIINRLIIETKRLLLKNELKNYEISYQLGFEEPSNLASFFKRYAFISMSDFKKTFIS
jgi:AraC-like DNA-binding protein